MNNPSNNIIRIILPSDVVFLSIALAAASSGLAIGIVDLIRQRVRRRLLGNQPPLGVERNALENAEQAGQVAAVAALLAAVRRFFPANNLLNFGLVATFAGLGIGIIDIIRIERVRRRAVGHVNAAQAAELAAAIAAIPPNLVQVNFGENYALRHAVREAERSMRAFLQENPEWLWHLRLTPLILDVHPSVDKILEHFASAPANIKSLWLHDIKLKAGSDLAKILAAVPKQVQHLLISQDLLDKIAIKGMCKDIDFCHATTVEDQRKVLSERGINALINSGQAIILKRYDPNKPRHFHGKLLALTKGQTPQLNDDALGAISKFLTFRDAAKISLSETLPRPMEANLSQFECKLEPSFRLIC